MNIKNQQIKDAVAFEKAHKISMLSVIEGAKVYQNASTQEKGMSVLLGYVSSFVDIANVPDINLPLDLTYSTVGNFTTALCYLFLIGRNSHYKDAQNIEILEKTVAAYLYFLAANEHDIKINVKSDAKSKKWTGIRITASKAIGEIDLLDSIIGKIRLVDKKTLEIKMDKIISAYENLTGVDLTDYSVDNVSAQLP